MGALEGTATLMARAVGSLILVSQLLLVWVAVAPSGTTAIWFSFVGTPCLILGCGLGVWALSRRLRRQAGAPPDLEASVED
jgi:hypothetical protein